MIDKGLKLLGMILLIFLALGRIFKYRCNISNNMIIINISHEEDYGDVYYCYFIRSHDG